MKLYDYPMKCCGMVQAFDINTGVPKTKTMEFDGWSEKVSTDEDWDNHLKQIEEHQRKHRRTCAMMVLSQTQTAARKAVERNGWKCIQEFWNPNSSYTCYIYTKILWEDKAVFRADEANGRCSPFGRLESEAQVWTRPHNEWMDKESEAEFEERVEEEVNRRLRAKKEIANAV